MVFAGIRRGDRRCVGAVVSGATEFYRREAERNWIGARGKLREAVERLRPGATAALKPLPAMPPPLPRPPDEPSAAPPVLAVQPELVPSTSKPRLPDMPSLATPDSPYYGLSLKELNRRSWACYQRSMDKKAAARALLPAPEPKPHQVMQIEGWPVPRTLQGYGNIFDTPDKWRDTRGRETAVAALKMLRNGVSARVVLDVLHAINVQRANPLDQEVIQEAALWAAEKVEERSHVNG